MGLDLSQSFPDRHRFSQGNWNNYRQCGYEIEYQVSRTHFRHGLPTERCPQLRQRTGWFPLLFADFFACRLFWSDLGWLELVCPVGGGFFIFFKDVRCNGFPSPVLLSSIV